MNNEIITNNELEFKTKLHKALRPDENGMVSARHLYDMLGLNPSNYSKWCKNNFYTDLGLIDGVKLTDYPFVPKYERTDTGVEARFHSMETELSQIGIGIQPNPSQDYLISIRIANRICLKSKSEHREEILEYFLDLEEAMPKTALAIQEKDELINMLVERVEQLGQLVQDTRQEQLERLDTISARLDIVEEKGEVVLDSPTEWAADMMKHVRKIADFYTRGDTNKCMDRLIERAEEYMCETYETLKADFAAHSNGKKAKKILIMARDEDTRDAFERAVKNYEIEFGLYEQNAGQKFLEEITKDMLKPGDEDYTEEHTPRWNPSDEELAAQYADMEKMYGPGWDKGDDYGSKDSDE